MVDNSTQPDCDVDFGNRIAAVNNAHWCNLMCQLHGVSGEFTGEYWVSAGRVPPLYPNLVTTSRRGTGQQLKRIAELSALVPAQSLAVKDSFESLALEELGFSVLFRSEWYCRPPLPFAAGEGSIALAWSHIESSAGLLKWEAAWREKGGLLDLQPTPFFPPQLLLQQGVGVLACHSGEGIVAGAIAFERDGAVGLTNFFSDDGDKIELYSSCLKFISQEYLGTYIVGYEDVGFSSRFEALSVAPAGTLRVWARPEPITQSL